MVHSAHLLSRAAATALGLIMITVSAVSAESIKVGTDVEVVADSAVNLRREPGTLETVVGVVSPGAILPVRAGPETTETGDWYQVEVDGLVGWIRSDMLAAARARGLSSRGNDADRRGGSPAPAADPARIALGAEMTVVADGHVNLRAEPGTLARVIGTIAPARVVFVREGPSTTETGDWYRVEFDGEVGWLRADTLAERGRATASSPTRRDVPAAARSSAPAPEPSHRGAAIAARALQMVGAPYSWGGTSPRYGFDCSGLIVYVLNGFGVYPGRTVDAQAGMGRRVSVDQLEPGDVVFFANTFQWGLSHNGIYVGGGRFVHAEDYGVGVRVSSLFGGYWGAHYAGARRVW